MTVPLQHLYKPPTTALMFVSDSSLSAYGNEGVLHTAGASFKLAQASRAPDKFELLKAFINDKRKGRTDAVKMVCVPRSTCVAVVTWGY